MSADGSVLSSFRRNRLTALLAGAVAALTVAVVAPGPASGAEPPGVPYLEPGVVLASGLAGHADPITSVEAYSDDAAVVQYERTGRWLWYGAGAHRELAEAAQYTLADGWVVTEAYGGGDSLSIQSFDGSITRTVALGDTSYVATVRDGWLAIARGDDLGAGATTGHLLHTTIAPDGNTSTVDLGVALRAPAGLTMTQVWGNGASSADGANVSVTLYGLTGGFVSDVGSVVSVDPQSWTLTTLSPQSELILAVTGTSTYAYDSEWDGVNTTSWVTRYRAGTAVTWVGAGSDGLTEVGGVTTWLTWDENGAMHAERGNDDGSVTEVALPWWSDFYDYTGSAERVLGVVASGERIVAPVRGELRSYSTDGAAYEVLTPAHTAPLSIHAAAIEGDQVAWAADTGEHGVGTVWARRLSQDGAPTAVVERATGHSLALVNGALYALLDSGGDVSLARVSGGVASSLGSIGDVVARWVSISASSSSLFVNSFGQWDRSAVGPLPLGPVVDTAADAMGEGWLADAQVPETGGVSVTTTTTSGAQRTFTDADAFALQDIRGAGQSLVWVARTGGGTNGTEGRVWEADVSTGSSRVLTQSETAEIAAISSSHVAITDGSVTTVYDLGDGQPAFQLDTAVVAEPFDPCVVALGPTWVAWVRDGVDGDELVAARIPGAPLFADVPVGAPFVSEISWLVGAGVTSGYADGGFHPTAAVSRQAMAAFLYRYAGSPAFTAPAVSPFNDVATDSGFYTEICWLADRGISGGYADGGFHPTAPVSRQAMAAFLYRFAGEPAFNPPASTPFTDLATDSAFYPPVTWLADAGITGGYADGGFHSSAAVSRQAMAAFLYRYDTAMA